MIPKQAIEKAIEGAYKIDLDWFTDLPIYAHAQIVVDPLFWQALGSALGWEDETLREPTWAYDTGHIRNVLLRDWQNAAHTYYQLILTGSDTEKYWAELLS